jgi:hypothetical protein
MAPSTSKVPCSAAHLRRVVRFRDPGDRLEEIGCVTMPLNRHTDDDEASHRAMAEQTGASVPMRS